MSLDCRQVSMGPNMVAGMEVVVVMAQNNLSPIKKKREKINRVGKAYCT